jgi:dihydrofolate reductase
MARVVAVTNVTLDGVMQGPGREDEDRRGGFEHGGWAVPYAAMMDLGPTMGATAALVLGRRTYEDFYSVWPKRRGDPFSAILDNMRKYVASRTLGESLPWQNSTLLAGDAAEALGRLKAAPGGDLVILGSGELIGSLLGRNVIDEFTLLIHPVVLGSGRRLFPDGASRAALALASSRTTAKGVIIASYRPS